MQRNAKGGDNISTINDRVKAVRKARGMTLEAGYIIATGTPAGVGMGFDPPRYMKPGDVVECEVQGLGVLRNPIKE